MKLQKLPLLAAILAFTASSHAAIQLKWSATASETKTIYALTGSNYTVDWGDGTTDSKSNHTYTTAGDYTVVIDGTVTSLDLRGDDATAGASGITAFTLTEADKSLTTLNIWGNSSLKTIDVSNALALQSINTTADPITSLDLSKNTALTSIDLKLCSSLTDLTVASTYDNLTAVDVNNSALTACSLNALFNALPSKTGTIYTVGCTGDATSTPSVATGKGWTFGNGGSGDGSAVCTDPLGEVSNVNSGKQGSTDNYTITWDEASGATGYSVRLFKVSDSSLCTDQFAYSTGASVTLNDITTPDDYQYYVYSVSGNNFVKSGPYKLNTTPTGIAQTAKDNSLMAYTNEGVITVCNAPTGETIRLYAIDGSLLSAKTAASQIVTFKANTGNYIITAGNETLKVSVLGK